MNAEWLISLYERVADAPDVVSRLRNFVLDLAVRGKLVEQVSADVSAAKLLDEIGQARKRLGIKSSGMSLEIGETPFSLPLGWGWTRLGDICAKTGSGSTPRGGKDVYKETGIPFLRSQNIYNDGLRLDDVVYINPQTHDKMKATSVIAGDLLLNITGGSMGRCARVPSGFEGANVSQHVAIIRPAVEGLDAFLHHLILSPYFQAFIFDEQTGAGRGGLPKNRMDQIVVALPPLAEQRRIVAKVDELIALLGRLEATRQQREATRDSLAVATLARLAASDTPVEDAITHSRFALNTLPAISARPDQITALRQTILNLAVCGKLAPQTHEETLGSTQRTSSEALAFSFSDDFAESKLELPLGWGWRPIRELTHHVTDGEHATPPRISEQQVPLVTAKNVRDGHMDYAQTDWVSFETASKAWKRCRPIVNDLLMVCVGATTGRLTVLRTPKDMVLVRSVALIRPTAEIDSDYFAWAIRSPVVQGQIWRSVKASAQPCLYINRIQGLLIPVPHLAEQRRIVVKVETLMALCDQLEAALSRADATRSRLLETLLHEALRPRADFALEAAE